MKNQGHTLTLTLRYPKNIQITFKSIRSKYFELTNEIAFYSKFII